MEPSWIGFVVALHYFLCNELSFVFSPAWSAEKQKN